MILYTNYLLKEIQNQSQFQAENTAIETTSGQKITWQELNQKIDNLASSLIKNGFEKKDKVLFLVKPSIEAIVVLLGVVRAGGVLITADPAMGEENFRSRVKLSKPKWVFCESVILALQNFTWIRGFLRTKGLEIPEMKESLNGLRIVKTGIRLPGIKSEFNLHDWVKKPFAKQKLQEQSLQDEDVQITFTSGTTSKPKGVVHTSRSFDSMVKLVQKNLASTKQDIFFTNQYYIALPALASGSKVVLNTNLRLKPNKYINYLTKFEITHTFDIPHNLQQIIVYCKQKQIKLPKNVLTILTGSAPILKSFLKNLQQITDPRVIIWSVYGMTEILPVAAITAKEKLAYEGEGDLLGKLFAGVETKFAEDGELLVRGENMCNRFLESEKLDFVQTGDICKIDQLGRLVLKSRKKDMIIKSNYNIYPTLFENTISQISGVKQCSMIGIYNQEKQDEDIILAVVADDQKDQKKFTDYLKEELKSGPYSIDRYAFPDKIIVLSKLPTFGRNLKVDKEQLKKTILENG